MNLHEGAERVRQLAQRIETCATPPPELMPELLEMGRAMLIGRTLSNQDSDGGEFAPYSRRPITINHVHYKDGYYQYKVDKHGSGAPNLRDTGDMMAAIETEVESPSKGRIFIGDSEQMQKAVELEHGTAAMPARPWWSLGRIPEELAKLTEFARESMKASVVRIIHGNA